jgi:hypothetical protein
MTVEELRGELEKIVAGLTSSGFGTIDPETIEKLGKLTLAAGELGMKSGQHLIENLSTVMKAIQEGKSNEGSGQVRLTALDFYIQHIKGGGLEEEL